MSLPFFYSMEYFVVYCVNMCIFPYVPKELITSGAIGTRGVPGRVTQPSDFWSMELSGCALLARKDQLTHLPCSLRTDSFRKKLPTVPGELRAPL